MIIIKTLTSNSQWTWLDDILLSKTDTEIKFKDSNHETLTIYCDYYIKNHNRHDSDEKLRWFKKFNIKVESSWKINDTWYLVYFCYPTNKAILEMYFVKTKSEAREKNCKTFK